MNGRGLKRRARTPYEAAVTTRQEQAFPDCADRLRMRSWRRRLEKKLGLGQSALSRLLARLRHDKLAATRKDAQNVYYSTNHPGVRKILDSLQSIELSGKDH